MSLSRKYSKLFGGSLSPTGNVAQFGSYKAGSPVYSLDPDIIQALDAYTNGWQYAGVTGNVPTIEDFNALIYLISRQQCYLHQMGIPEWNSETTYRINSYIQQNGSVYSSLIDNNLNNAVTDATKWQMWKSTDTTPITDNYTLSNEDYHIIWESLTSSGHDTITFPTASSSLKGRKYIITVMVTGSQVKLVSNSIQFNMLEQVGTYQVICQGTYWLTYY